MLEIPVVAATDTTVIIPLFGLNVRDSYCGCTTTDTTVIVPLFSLNVRECLQMVMSIKGLLIRHPCKINLGSVDIKFHCCTFTIAV